MQRTILLNRIKCNACDDIITSYYTHDFKHCSCGMVAIDGGRDYLKRTGSLDYTDMSVFDEGNHDLRRENVHWGVSYDNTMTRRPETRWTPIKDLTTAHIESIINNGYGSEDMREILNEELKFRK